MNDDVTFTAKLCESDFWTPEKGFKIYHSGRVQAAKVIFSIFSSSLTVETKYKELRIRISNHILTVKFFAYW